jgi:hypothetical protein
MAPICTCEDVLVGQCACGGQSIDMVWMAQGRNCLPGIPDTNEIPSVLFGMQNRIVGPHLAATNRISTSVMRCVIIVGLCFMCACICRFVSCLLLWFGFVSEVS